MRRYRRVRGWSLGTKSPELFGLWETSASPNLWLTGDTLVTEGIIIFQMWHLRLSRQFHIKFKGIKFEVSKTYRLFMFLRQKRE